MDPELLQQLLAGLGPQQHFIQQDATAAPPRSSSGGSRSFIEMLRSFGNSLGEQTLGRALTTLTIDPRTPEGQQAYDSALGLAADFMPGVGDFKAVAHDAPRDFAEGHPVAGALAVASALPLFGLPLDIARKGRAVDDVLEVEHFGPQVHDIDQLDPAFGGTGLRGPERQTRDRFPDDYVPRTYFYTGGRGPEPDLRGRPSVKGQFARSDFVNLESAEELQPYVDRARAQLQAEGRVPVGELVQERILRLIGENGLQGFYNESQGILVKTTPTELPRGAANRGIIEATRQYDGATFSVGELGAGENLAGQPYFAVARPTPDGRKDWMTLEPGEELTAEHLNEFRSRFADELSDPEASIGTWKGADGRTAIDVVETLQDREEAMRRGVERGQDAIFDLESLQEVELVPAPRDRTPRQLAASRASRTSEASMAARRAEIESGLTPEELTRYQNANKGTRGRVEDFYARLPTPEDFAQVAIRGAAQRGWYKASADALRESFGPDAGRFAALLAATSPNKSVKENVRYATETWANWVEAGRPSDPEVVKKLITSPLPADQANALRSLTASEDVVQAGDFDFLSGPKVEPFARNLFGEVDPVVNDTWMARSYGTNKEGVGAVSRVLAQNALTRNAAKVFEQITGTPVTAREIQEMVWSVVRGLGETSREAGGSRSAVETLERALRDPELMQRVNAQIADSDPIGVLLSQPEYAANLQRAGVRPPAERTLHGTPNVRPESADVNALRDIAYRMDDGAFYSALLAIGGASLAQQVMGDREGR